MNDVLQTSPTTKPRPVRLSWEEFCPHTLGVTFGDGVMASRAKAIRPIGDGKPFLGIYKLHDGRFTLDPDLNTTQIKRFSMPLVVTLDTEVVGVVHYDLFWIHPSQRKNGVDLAAELWAAHAVATDFGFTLRKHVPSVTEALVKVSKRAYRLLVDRGVIDPGNNPLP